MVLKLKIPVTANTRPVLRGGMGRLKGREDRLRNASDNEMKGRILEVRMQIVMICYSLWVGFWLQFVTSVTFNMPAMHTLSGGNWYAPEVWFYLPTPSSFPFSTIAGNFLFYSCIGSAMALVFGWLCTTGVAGKWRLRSMVVLFVAIILGWSISAYMAEKAAWTQGLTGKIAQARLFWHMSAERGGDEWELRYYRERIEELEALEKRSPYLKK